MLASQGANVVCRWSGNTPAKARLCSVLCIWGVWHRYLISQHPEVEQRILEELAQHQLMAGPHSSARAIQYEDLGRLTYLNCVIKVSLVVTLTHYYSSRFGMLGIPTMLCVVDEAHLRLAFAAAYASRLHCHKLC